LYNVKKEHYHSETVCNALYPSDENSFNKLNKDLLTPKGMLKKIVQEKHRYLDLWILVGTGLEDIEPTVSLILQLGWLINNVDVWKKFHKLRVVYIVDSPTKIENEKQRMKKLLYLVRVPAEILIVNFEKSDFEIIQQDINSELTQSEPSYKQLSMIYKKLTVQEKYNVLNKVMLRNSEKTSL
jgi:hypothetical protein